MHDAIHRRVNLNNMKNALGSVPQLIELAQQAQSSIQRLGLDEHLRRGFRGLLQIVPVRTVATVSFPLAAASFGAGMVTGAAAAALFTPKRGDELRASLRQGMQRAWSRATSRSHPASEGDGGEALDELDRGDTKLRAYGEVRERQKAQEIAPPSTSAKVAH